MSDVDEIKSRLNIVDIIGERVSLKKAGRNFKGLCPFHKEKSPSFMVSPDRQVFHCFGCGKGGSVIDFVMEYNHVDFMEALEDLAGKANVKLTKRAGQSQEEKIREKLFEVNKLASDYYQYILTKHALGEKARLYLKNRGIFDKSIKTFGIGYSPNSWEALFSFLQKKGYDGPFLEKAGLVVKGNRGWYDRFRGRVMFTLRDHRGNVVGFSGRVLDPTIKAMSAGRQDAKYINTSETPVYIKSNMLFALDVTKDAISKSGEAIIMEGEMDVISSFQAGVGNVVAIKGSALTEGHVNLLKRFAQKLIFCLDTDLAGDAAARRGIDIAERAGFDMKAIIIPSGKDPDEAAREDAVGFKKAVNAAVPIYDFIIDSLKKRYDLTSPFDKRKASDEFLPFLSRMTNTIVQGHYVKKFAGTLDVSEDTVIDGMKKVKVPLTESMKIERKKEKDTRPHQEIMETYLLALMVQGDTQIFSKAFFAMVHLEEIQSQPLRQVLAALQTYLSEHEVFDAQVFAETLPKELVPILDEAYLWDMSSVVERDGYEKEWEKTLYSYKRSTLRERIKQCTVGKHDDEETQQAIVKLTEELSRLEKGRDF